MSKTVCCTNLYKGLAKIIKESQTLGIQKDQFF